jgi:hypothetical protein
LNKELLIASEDMKDSQRRKVYTWTGNTPVAHIIVLDDEAR